MQPTQSSQVADLGGGQFRGGREVELLQGDPLLELRFEPRATVEGDALASGDLVLTEDLEEVKVAELASMGPHEAGLQGLQHPGQPQDRLACGRFLTHGGFLRIVVRSTVAPTAICGRPSALRAAPSAACCLELGDVSAGGTLRLPMGIGDMMSRSDRALGLLEAIRGRALAASGGPEPGTPRGTFPGEGPVISKRAVTAAAVAATAAVLLASGDAYACSIGDFSAKATCDTSTGEARAAITITDKDPSGTPATSPMQIRMAVGTDGETVGTGHIDHPTAAGASTTILVPWSVSNGTSR